MENKENKEEKKSGGNDLVKKIIVGLFISVPLASSVISAFHLYSFLCLGNRENFAVTISIIYEICSIATLYAIVILNRLNPFFVWASFILVTILQYVGNIYYSFDFIQTALIQYPKFINNFSKMLNFVYEMRNIDDISMVLALMIGLPIPTLSLFLTKSLTEYLKKTEPNETIDNQDLKKKSELDNKKLISEDLEILAENLKPPLNGSFENATIKDIKEDIDNKESEKTSHLVSESIPMKGHEKIIIYDNNTSIDNIGNDILLGMDKGEKEITPTQELVLPPSSKISTVLDDPIGTIAVFPQHHEDTKKEKPAVVNTFPELVDVLVNEIKKDLQEIQDEKSADKIEDTPIIKAESKVLEADLDIKSEHNGVPLLNLDDAVKNLKETIDNKIIEGMKEEAKEKTEIENNNEIAQTTIESKEIEENTQESTMNDGNPRTKSNDPFSAGFKMNI